MQEVYFIAIRKLGDDRIQSIRFELEVNAMVGNPELVIMVYNGEPMVIYQKPTDK